MSCSAHWLAALVAVIAAGCSPAQRQRDSAAAGVSGQTRVPPAPGGAAGESSDIARLEAEVRSLVKTSGCQIAAQCRVAPIGSKACGGPRGYIVYCSLTTDSAALHRKLEELRRAEAERNQREGLVSDCSLALPPSVDVSGGSCRAAATAEPVPQ
jgi:hypothetical protein